MVFFFPDNPNFPSFREERGVTSSTVYGAFLRPAPPSPLFFRAPLLLQFYHTRIFFFPAAVVCDLYHTPFESKLFSCRFD